MSLTIVLLLGIFLGFWLGFVIAMFAVMAKSSDPQSYKLLKQSVKMTGAAGQD